LSTIASQPPPFPDWLAGDRHKDVNASADTVSGKTCKINLQAAVEGGKIVVVTRNGFDP